MGSKLPLMAALMAMSMMNQTHDAGLMDEFLDGKFDKPKKPKKDKVQYSDEDLSEMERLKEDRSSPGRKAYKKFCKSLQEKYRGTNEQTSTEGDAV